MDRRDHLQSDDCLVVSKHFRYEWNVHTSELAEYFPGQIILIVYVNGTGLNNLSGPVPFVLYFLR